MPALVAARGAHGQEAIPLRARARLGLAAAGHPIDGGSTSAPRSGGRREGLLGVRPGSACVQVRSAVGREGLHARRGRSAVGRAGSPPGRARLHARRASSAAGREGLHARRALSAAGREGLHARRALSAVGRAGSSPGRARLHVRRSRSSPRRGSELDLLPAAAGELGAHDDGRDAGVGEGRDPDAVEPHVEDHAEDVRARDQPTEDHQ